MPKYILKIDTKPEPKYLEWSTIVDAPTTYGVTLDEFKYYYLKRYGTEGFKDLQERLDRADKTGSSCAYGTTLEDTISGNRAGPNETELSLEQIIETYCNPPKKKE